jgi:pimeloyl-ACP methyl ester carboxylesterase
MSEPSFASEIQPAPEACPPPLAWEEVLQGVEDQGERFTHECEGIEIEGLSIGEGPAIWFFNGFAGDRQLYSLLAWLLRDRFRCVLSDVTWPDDIAPKSLPALVAQAYQAAFDALGAVRPTLFGTAFGAHVALKMLVPEGLRDVRAAVLHAGFVQRRPSRMERLLAWGASRSAKRLIEVPNWAQIQEANHRRWFPPIDPTRWEFLLKNLGATPVKRWSLMARGSATSHLNVDLLREVQTPVLLLRTEGDGPVVTAAMSELMVHFPNVREETLHTSGHFAFLTHPHRVAKIIAGFLGSIADVPVSAAP